MVKIAIADIVADHTLQIRERGNRDATITRYMASFDRLPPPVVYATPDGKLLADGFARLEAGKRLGRAHLDVELRKGSRRDAIEYAAIANATSGDPLSEKERNTAILLLHADGKGWGSERIASEMSVHLYTVEQVIKSEVLRKQLVEQRKREAAEARAAEQAREERARAEAEAAAAAAKERPEDEPPPPPPPESEAPRSDEAPEQKRKGHTHAADLPRTYLNAIGRLPEADQVPIANITVARGWTRDELREAVNNLLDKSGRVPEEHKTALRAGETDPRVWLNQYESHWLPETLKRRIKDATQPSVAQRALERAYEALAEAEQHEVDEAIGTMDGKTAKRVAALAGVHISYLERVREVAGWQP